MIGGFFLALAYFGTDQSQVQRYLTARSLKQSRLSLIFNAFVKVPMQFMILSIGVLLFVFYHFERPPLVFNPAEVEQVQASPRGAEFREMEAEHAALHGQRRDATLELLAEREAGRDLALLQSSIRDYDERMSDLRQESKGLIAEVRGASSNDVNYVFPVLSHPVCPGGAPGTHDRGHLRRRDVLAGLRADRTLERHRGRLLPALVPGGTPPTPTICGSPGARPSSGACSRA